MLLEHVHIKVLQGGTLLTAAVHQAEQVSGGKLLVKLLLVRHLLLGLVLLLIILHLLVVVTRRFTARSTWVLWDNSFFLSFVQMVLDRILILFHLLLQQNLLNFFIHHWLKSHVLVLACKEVRRRNSLLLFTVLLQMCFRVVATDIRAESMIKWASLLGTLKDSLLVNKKQMFNQQLSSGEADKPINICTTRTVPLWLITMGGSNVSCQRITGKGNGKQLSNENQKQIDVPVDEGRLTADSWTLNRVLTMPTD